MASDRSEQASKGDDPSGADEDPGAVTDPTGQANQRSGEEHTGPEQGDCDRTAVACDLGDEAQRCEG
ncbi:hypothetical protein HC251_24700 (plasmid) [Iamia sp. SCSIO 61187]|nr:hypothetical protein HC251_24700 [Iamia sp. SCSIO 61187]